MLCALEHLALSHALEEGTMTTLTPHSLSPSTIQMGLEGAHDDCEPSHITTISWMSLARGLSRFQVTLEQDTLHEREITERIARMDLEFHIQVPHRLIFSCCLLFPPQMALF